MSEVLFCLLQLPNFNSLAFVSLVAAVMSVTYSTVGWTTAVADGRVPGQINSRILQHNIIVSITN